MSVDPPCHRGVLPRPRKDVGSIEYYIAATDRRSSESRTAQHSLLVSADGRCATGPLAPVADVGGVVIGSTSGAAPTGFITGGVSPLLIAGGVAVVGVAVAAVLAATGDDEPPSSPAGVWRSELRPQGARGQVVVDGSREVFATAGSESFDTPLSPGVHRFEATLVAAPRGARDSPGTWRFDLSRLGVAAGTLRVVAGEAVESGGDAVVFRLSGRSGERVGFVFEVR
jgi:hypothetical protein